ncbi:MAG: amidase [bacterium]
MSDEIAYKTAAQLGACYREKTLSPVEVTRATLDRIAANQPTLNAFCLVDESSALAAARASEQRWGQGRPLGPLDGVPTSIKDIIVTKGWPTLRGSKTIDPKQPWEEDGPCVARLREQGVVLVGKTTTPEFAAKGVTDSPLTGITRNPWNTGLTPGGSSGGAGAAVAAGLCHLAVGTDAGGSIRIPASFSGVFGHKPSYGRVPVYPLTPYAPFAGIGPMTRTVEDAAMMLNAMARPDPRDWNALPYDGRDFLQGLDDGVEGLRIAFSPTFGYAKVEPEVAKIVAGAVEVFGKLGAAVERKDPGFENPEGIRQRLWRGLTVVAFKNMPEEKIAMLDPQLVQAIAESRAASLMEYLEADLERAALGKHMWDFHQRYDLLLSPTLAVQPFPVGRNTPDETRWPSTMDWNPFTFPFNLTRQPAASVPCGFTADGLPVGLQIVGPPHGDALVLRAARAFEKERPWQDRRPPL